MEMHRSSIAEVLMALQTDSNGLPASRVSELRSAFGSNILEGKPPRPAWMILMFQFKDVMILILMAAAVISGILGDLTDTIIIFVIVILNALLGFGIKFILHVQQLNILLILSNHELTGGLIVTHLDVTHDRTIQTLELVL